MPGRTSPTKGDISRAQVRSVAALIAVWEMAEPIGPDFSGTVTSALPDVSTSVGGVGVLVRSRRGLLETTYLRRLAIASGEFDQGLGR